MCKIQDVANPKEQMMAVSSTNNGGVGGEWRQGRRQKEKGTHALKETQRQQTTGRFCLDANSDKQLLKTTTYETEKNGNTD